MRNAEKATVMKKKYGRGLVACVLIAAIAMTTVSCEPLRKKFIRKKKTAQETSEDIPILDPIDYPEKVYSTEDIYKQHYSLWQVWQRELLMDIENSPNVKKQLYDLEQLIAQLQEMQALLAADRQAKLKTILQKFEMLREEINQPVPFKNRTTIRLQVESIGKRIRQEYKLNQIKESLNKNVSQ